MKLQQVIDAAFGARDAAPPPQNPSDAFKEREQAFQAKATKIERLRLARLSDIAPAKFVFEVVRHRGHWRTLHNGKRSAPFADQSAAILAAKKLARQKGSEGHSVEVILRRMDGDSVAQSIDNDECSSK